MNHLGPIEAQGREGLAAQAASQSQETYQRVK